MRPVLTLFVLGILAASALHGPAAGQDAPAHATPSGAAPVPAGAYTIDKAHTSLIFRVSHLGFSNYTGRFEKVDAKLQFDPANPADSRITVNIDPRSIESDNAPAGFLDTLRGAQWLNTAKFPDMMYRSTRVARTGGNNLRIQGDLTLHGVTRPVALDGGYTGHPMDPHARIGFSAHGTFKRSDFGIALGIPAPGTTMGVSDDVEVIIETEFSGPPLATAPSAPSR
jgi:polyisoprenoid-binding protein YceI